MSFKKPKTIVIATKFRIKEKKGELQVKTSKLLEARESARDQVTIAFSFEFDWLREWRALILGQSGLLRHSIENRSMI